MVDFLAVQPIAGADLNAVEAVENVELGQRQPSDAAGADGLPHQNRIEPAASARPAGIGAELPAPLADLAADLVVLLGRERTLADPGRVGLADAKHIADRARAHTGAGRGLCGHRVGRGDVRVSAVVDVEQCALRALEQDALALAALDVEQPPHRIGIGQQFRRHRHQLSQDHAAIEFRQLHATAQRVVMRQQTFDLVRQGLVVREVHQADGAAAHLVFIGRADAAARGADRGRSTCVLAHRIELAVQRQDQRDVLGDTEIFRTDGDALPLQPLHFVEKGLRIEHHAIADHGKFRGPQHTRGQ
ncbi:hypothetical protein ES703_40838 [subsurface metagenome]